MWAQRFYRWIISGWLFLGHGFPKLASWILGAETWGPHIHYRPRNTASMAAALIEFVCPLLIILGLRIKWNAALVGGMMALSSFALPLPWLHIRVPVEGFSIPFAIIPSHQLSVVHALAFIALLFFAQDERFWIQRKKFRSG